MSTKPTQPDGPLAALGRRRTLRALAIFALVFGLGFAAWSVLDVPFARAFRSLCTLVVGPLTFGNGGHVKFVASQPKASLERAASWDVSMLLRIDNLPAEHAIALNPRRLLYLPLLTLSACVLAAPLPLLRRQRRTVLLVAVPALIALALLSVWLIAVFLFAQVEGLVYTLAPWQTRALRIAYEGWVTPLTNKFVMPLLLAAALLSWQLRQNAKGVPPRARTTERALERPKASPAKASSARPKQRSQKRGTSRKGSTAARRP